MTLGTAPFVDPRTARILIIEDEPMLAISLEESLVDAGFAIAGVAGRLEAALAMIARGDCDAAIVDANLAGVCAAPVASALTACGVPFIVVSGYSRVQLKSAFAAAVVLQKPYHLAPLVAALESILQAR